MRIVAPRRGQSSGSISQTLGMEAGALTARAVGSRVPEPGQRRSPCLPVPETEARMTAPERPPTNVPVVAESQITGTSGARMPSRRLAAWVAVLFAVAFFVAGRVAQPDLGLSWDEPVHHHAGELLYRYYASRGARDAILRFHNLYLYGGLFDLTCEAMRRLAPSWPVYDLKHLITLALGAMALFFTVGLAARLRGLRAGIVAGALLFASPRWFGHALFNPKDIPFAVFFLVAVDAVVRLAGDERPRWRSWLLFFLGTAASLGVRAGGLLLVPLLAFGLWSRRSSLAPAGVGRPTATTWLAGAGATLAAAAAGFVFWPYLHRRTWPHLLEILHANAHAPFAANMLFRGQWVSAQDVGREYLPTWLAIATPLPVLAGLGLALAAAVVSARRRQGARGGAAVVVVALSALVPIGLAVAGHATLYDGMRHFLFVVPPLTVLAALGWDWALGGVARRSGRIALAVALAALLVEPASWLVRGHPYQYVYFNPLAGGLARASHRYDAEYWGLSLRPAAERLEKIAMASPEKRRLRVCTNVPRILLEPFFLQPKRIHTIGFGARRTCDYDLAFARFTGLDRVLNPRGVTIEAGILVPGQVPFFVLSRETVAPRGGRAGRARAASP